MRTGRGRAELLHQTLGTKQQTNGCRPEVALHQDPCSPTVMVEPRADPDLRGKAPPSLPFWKVDITITNAEEGSVRGFLGRLEARLERFSGCEECCWLLFVVLNRAKGHVSVFATFLCRISARSTTSLRLLPNLHVDYTSATPLVSHKVGNPGLASCNAQITIVRWRRSTQLGPVTVQPIADVERC